VSLFRHTRLSVSGQSAREQSHAGLSHKPFHIVLLLGVALVTIAYDSDRSADQKFEASPQAERGPGPIPLDGPLARPKSLEQIGVPVEATRAVAPADNPQTPEKIALGEKLFSTGACQWMELLPAVRATIRHVRSLTEGQCLLASTGAPASATLRRY
jgi:hypothetical protein